LVQRKSVRQDRLLKELGTNIRRWRKLNNLSASDLAARAFVTRETLRNLEEGTAAPRVDSLIAILTALGIVDAVIDSTNPYNNQAARVRIDDLLGSGGSL
jgi:transcriptional regulator with XRE-family HTH domain